MKTQMNGKFKERSSLATRGRFFLFFFSFVSICQFSNAAVPEDTKEEVILEDDSLQNFTNDQPAMYVTGDAQLTDPEKIITGPIIILKEKNKNDISKKKEKEKVKVKQEIKKTHKRPVQKKVSISHLYFNNPQDKEYAHFDVGLDKAVVTTTHQIKLFSVNTILILNLVLFVSIYLVCFFKENTFFIPFLGKNFQRPPPHFSIQLF
ncbi:hypothetical protein [Chryseobacterium arachidis]|nr:hypothetical protein [Chryseobacterium arachidis]